MQYVYKYPSPVGELAITSDGDALTGVWFDGQKYFADKSAEIREEKTLPIFEQTKEWLDCYFSGRNPVFTPPLHLEGSPFRLAVWEILKTIPYGKVISYKDIADEIARTRGIEKMSAQAVGGAVGHNPISIIIPCHRVVGSNGSLTGFGGGLARKIRLLELERTDMEKLFMPKKGTAL